MKSIVSASENVTSSPLSQATAAGFRNPSVPMPSTQNGKRLQHHIRQEAGGLDPVSLRMGAPVASESMQTFYEFNLINSALPFHSD
jgi:hypothetical protein